MNHNLKIGDLILITIKRLGINGEGIGYYKRLAVFVEGTIPGEVVEVKITEVMPKYVYAEAVKFKTRSEHRIKPEAEKLMKSGLVLQHINYKEQLVLKRQVIEEAFARYYDGELNSRVFKATIGMEDLWHYRNQSRFPVRHDGEKVVVGLFEHKTNRLIHLNEYKEENKVLGATISLVLDYLTKREINIYNPRFDQGNLRFIIFRGFEETNEVQVTFILREAEPRILNILKSVNTLANIKSVNYSINKDPKSIKMIDGEVINLSGDKKINGIFGDFKFRVSVNSFLENNLLQTKVLYDEVTKQVDFKNTDNVLELYSGIGLLSATLAKGVKSITAYDESIDNISDANDLKELNNLGNISFNCGNIDRVLNRKFPTSFAYLIVSPPPSGLSLGMINNIRKLNPKTIIYISTNPSTLAKNINHLQKTYKVNAITPVDIAPNTPYINSITLLKKK